MKTAVIPTKQYNATFKYAICFGLSLIVLPLLSFTSYGQSYFALIEKNKNIEVKERIDKLSATNDTLILQSDKKIDALYTIYDDPTNELDFRINAKSHKLPLRDFKKGRHLFVAIQFPNQIVFVVEILKERTKPETLKVLAELYMD